MLEEGLQHISLLRLVGLGIALLIGRHQWQAVVEKRRIEALGGAAAARKQWLPWGIDWIIQAFYYIQRHQDLRLWQNLFRQHGRPANPYTVEFRVAGDRYVFTADPDNTKALLAAQFADFGKGPQFRDEWYPFLGDSIFSVDGDSWHTSRALIRPQFVKDRVSDLDTFENHVRVLFSFLQDGQTVNIADLFFRYTLDAATDFLLGRSVDSLRNPQVKFARAFQEVQTLHSLMARIGKFRVLVPRGSYWQSLAILNDFVNPYIEEALALSDEDLQKRTDSDNNYTFLHALASHTRDRKVLRDQIVAVLLAGRDTTACTLSWLFYELSMHPEVVQKLRREIVEVVGLEKPPTYANLKSMRYLQHTMNEVLRLYPVIPYNVRVALKDTTLPRGGGPDGNAPVGITAKTICAYSPLLMQRRPDLYPAPSPSFPPVEEFAPDRWSSWTPKAWTYIPFNGGPRLCVGQQFALTEMGYTAVRLLQRFSHVTSRMNGEVPPMQADIVLQPHGGVKVAFLD